MSDHGKEIDCRFTDEIVCPYCGKVQSDSWEYESGKNECGWCELDFMLEVNETITYSSYKITPKETP